MGNQASLVKEVSESQWEQMVLESSTPVLVDLWAPWCGPCKALAPILDELSISLKEKITIVKVDVDQNPQLAASLGVRSIPTLMVYSEGQRVGSKSGALNKGQIESFIDTVL